jgi:hypothetical protein
MRHAPDVPELREDSAARAVYGVGDFPPANDLGGLALPFGADKLAGRNIGRFDPRTVSMLFDYTGDVAAIGLGTLPSSARLRVIGESTIRLSKSRSPNW